VGGGKERIDVATRENEKAGPKRRNDFVLEPVGKISGVKKAHGDATQGMPLLGLFQSFPCQCRAGHAGVQNGVTVIFQPLFQETDMRGSTNSIGPFQDDETALELV